VGEGCGLFSPREVKWGCSDLNGDKGRVSNTTERSGAQPSRGWSMGSGPLAGARPPRPRDWAKQVSIVFPSGWKNITTKLMFESPFMAETKGTWLNIILNYVLVFSQLIWSWLEYGLSYAMSYLFCVIV